MYSQNILLLISENSDLDMITENCSALKLLSDIKIHLLYAVPNVSLTRMLPSAAWLDAMWMDDAHRIRIITEIFWRADFEHSDCVWKYSKRSKALC